MIYDGFKEALAGGVPQDKAGILVDEQFGAAILRDAAKHGYNTSCPAEKSGQDEFDFEYGEDFAKHIEEFRPTFCKVLVRYNPEADATMNRRQAERLARLSKYLHSGGPSKFMFELLVPAEKAQLEKAGGDKKRYDRELRPGLMVQAIHDLQDAGVEAGRLEDRGDGFRRRTRRRSSRPRSAAGATMSAASSWAGVRMTRRCATGSRSPRRSRASSASPSAAPPSGRR